MSQNKSVEEVVERKGFFTFRFNYSDREGNRLFQESHINDNMYFDDAYTLAKKFIKEYPQSCMVWFERNRRVDEIIQQERQTSQEREREIVEEILKMIDYESGFDRRTNEHKPNPFDKGCISAADNFTRRIKAIAQKYNITLTNPNKD